MKSKQNHLIYFINYVGQSCFIINGQLLINKVLSESLYFRSRFTHKSDNFENGNSLMTGTVSGPNRIYNLKDPTLSSNDKRGDEGSLLCSTTNCGLLLVSEEGC